jgi:hypothetical protein
MSVLRIVGSGFPRIAPWWGRLPGRLPGDFSGWARARPLVEAP